jgi:hypothetical protein
MQKMKFLAQKLSGRKKLLLVTSLGVFAEKQPTGLSTGSVDDSPHSSHDAPQNRRLLFVRQESRLFRALV